MTDVTMKKVRPSAGQWVKLPRKRKIGCCDCGLIHDFEFKVEMKDGKPQMFFRAWRDDPLTEQHRKETWTPFVKRTWPYPVS